MPDGRVVALYCRISKAKNGRTDSVEDQEAWGRGYAAKVWPDLPVRVYVDNDITAANEDVTRKAFERLRADIAAGDVVHVWAVEQTRLERVEARWFRFAAELDAAGITEVHTNREGIIGLDEVAGIKAVLAAAEIRRLRRRIKDTLAARAAQGSPPGGAHFGYRHGTTDDGRKTFVIEPAEAEVVQWVADSILAGWGLANIARDLTARGVPTRRGGRWNEATIRQMVTKPSVAGLRSHHGDVIGPGNWPAILPEDRWRLVRHTLATRSHAVGQDGTDWPVRRHARGLTRRRWLLTGGVTVCGLCGHALTALQRTSKGRRTKPYYLCPTPLRGGCARIGIVAEPFEAEVVRRLLAHLQRPEFLEALAADDDAARRQELADALKALDVQRAELGRMWASRDIDAVGWQAARAGLDGQQRRLLAELAALAPPVGGVDPASIREDWEEMTLDERRQVVTLFIGKVTVHPARRGVPKFDPARVEVRGVDRELWPADGT
jgi:site-specific DNA recombinase